MMALSIRSMRSSSTSHLCPSKVTESVISASSCTISASADYSWRARTQGKDTVGEWSALQSFRLSSLPTEFRLDQNYPNPFNPDTKIGFSLPSQCNVTLEVFSLLGQRVATLHEGSLPAGYHEAIWNGSDDNGSPVATGVYFYRLSAENFVQTKKMVLLK